MYKLKRVVLLGETDCFQMMFFSRLQQWGVEILDSLTKENQTKGCARGHWFFLETQAQYSQPFLLNDVIEITVSLQEVNFFYFSLDYSFKKEKEIYKKNTLLISVAVVDQGQERFLPLSSTLRSSLIKI